MAVGLLFILDTTGGLCPNAENSHHKQQFAHSKRDVVGVDDLQFLSE
jgi:hypothetical protein